ncbi:MAG: hypothetical protein ACLRMZ_17985 [Blautia marasmi]
MQGVLFVEYGRLLRRAVPFCVYFSSSFEGLFFFQVRPENPVQQERVNIGRQCETEENQQDA